MKDRWALEQICESRHKPNSKVYFLDAEDAIKIGTSTNPDLRLKELQTSHYKTLKLIGVMPGGRNTETALHQMFLRHTILGEWFKPVKEIKDFVTANCTE